MKFFYVLFFITCPILLFSQSVIKNNDGSITVISDSTVYLDSNRNIINRDIFQDSLNTGNYVVSFKDTLRRVEFQLKKKIVTEHPMFRLGKKFPDLELLDINQNKITITANSNIQVSHFFQEKGIAWNNIKIVYDYPYSENFNITSVPFNVIIDKNKIIKKTIAGKDIKSICSYFDELKKK